MDHRFTIIIPTYERPRQLATCLQALTALDYPPDCFEVIVVDDGSRMPLDAVVSSFRCHLDLNLLVHPHAGPSAARNAGAAQAKGDFLAFTDDDCTPAPGWLRALADRFAADPECAVGGRTLNGRPNCRYATISQLIVDVAYAHYNADPHRAYFFASNNLAVPAAHFHALGGFDTEGFPFVSEDRDFCDRWVHAGRRLIYAPQAVVYHKPELTLRSFGQQYFRYGRGAFHFHQARDQRRSGDFRIERRFYRSLFLRSLAQTRGRQTLPLMLTLTLSQVANTAGFLWEWLTDK